MKREVIICVLLVIAMAPVLVQAAAPSQETDIRPLADVDVWVDQLGSYSFYWTSLDTDDRIYIDFEVTSGGDIDFFICDEDTYDLWVSGNSVTVYELHENVGSLSTSFRVPFAGKWHAVFRNDNLFTRKHIEGYVGLSPNLSTAGLQGVIVVVALLALVIIVGGICKFLGKQSAPTAHASRTDQRSASRTAGQMRAAYCPHCGVPRQPPSARFCSNCGASLGPPPDIS